jgi:hypothetical protein
MCVVVSGGGGLGGGREALLQAWFAQRELDRKVREGGPEGAAPAPSAFLLIKTLSRLRMNRTQPWNPTTTLFFKSVLPYDVLLRYEDLHYPQYIGAIFGNENITHMYILPEVHVAFGGRKR